MFLFNSNHGNDPISFTDHPFFHSPFSFDDEDLLFQQPEHDILLHDHHQTQPTFINMVDDSNNLNEQEIQRKKSSSNRDRHSKINTLRGPRDRRMRLSLPVAREFFGLQDMLGVDKASKTVEWLLYQARHEIKKLSRAQSFHDGVTARSASSISDSEVMSGIDETVVVDNGNVKRGGRRKVTTTKEKRGSRPTRKTVFQPLARECREKARARARARTQEKQLQITRKLNHVESTKQDLSKISSSWSTQIETGEESAGTTQIEDQTQRIFDDHHQDDSLMIMRRWSPSNSIYQSQQNNNGIQQEHPFGDYQFLGKPWEAYNNHGIC